MAVPPFQKFFLPFLQCLADQREHNYSDMGEFLISRLNLTPHDLEERISTGTKTKFYDRMSWTKTHLLMAGLLEQPGRGRFKITPKGMQVLASNPPYLDLNYLTDLSETYKAFRQRGNQDDHPDSVDHTPPQSNVSEELETPEEKLVDSYSQLRRILAAQVLEKARKCSPDFFEKLVIDLLLAMGYGGSINDAGRAVGRSGDGGIDGIIKEDKLGLDAVYIQAKRWESSVGAPVVRDFVGSLVSNTANKGVLITTSKFTKEAYELTARIPQRIVLIDGAQLAEMMVDNNVGVTTVSNYVLKKIDTDYFEDN